MVLLDGTALRCGTDCPCGQHHKLGEIRGTSLEIWVPRHSMKGPHRLSVAIPDLMRAISGTIHGR